MLDDDYFWSVLYFELMKLKPKVLKQICEFEFIDLLPVELKKKKYIAQAIIAELRSRYLRSLDE